MPYDTATLISKSPNQDGSGAHLTVEFTGPNVPALQKTFYMTGAHTAADLKAWARGEAATLNQGRALYANLAIGMSVDLTAPAEPARTAFDIWSEKARRLVRIKQVGLTNSAAVADVSGLEADVNATYQSGYAGQY